MSLPPLTLYQIEAQLLSLMEAREDADAEGDAEAVKAMDEEIRLYVKAEVKKADGIAAYIREAEQRAEIAALEAERLKQRAAAWKQKADYLKALTCDIMAAMDKKKLQGQLSTLRRQANGGVRPLTIAQELLVPEKYLQVVMPVPLALWNEKGMPDPPATMVRVNKQAVRDDLERGVGVPGCRLEEKGEHLRVE